MDYKKYLTAIYIVRNRQPDKNEIYQSLCVFDKERTGFIEVVQLKQILMQIGDIVSANEVPLNYG